MTAIATPPEGYMEDARGALIPLANVKPEHLAEDDLVREIAGQAETLSAALADFKRRALEDVAAFQELLAEKYGVSRGGRKGNLSLQSYDGRLRLRVQVSESISFGPELTAAKELIDACVERWSEGANANIRALVDHAFQVNKVGRIDTGRVLGLRRLDMGDDPDWARAMEAISDAVRISGSKTYLRIYRVDRETGAETPVALDLASL